MSKDFYVEMAIGLSDKLGRCECRNAELEQQKEKMFKYIKDIVSNEIGYEYDWPYREGVAIIEEIKGKPIEKVLQSPAQQQLECDNAEEVLKWIEKSFLNSCKKKQISSKNRIK